MIRHIVMWKFLDQANGRGKAENLRTAKQLLDDLPAHIPLIRQWEVGINCIESPQAYDLVLSSLFDTAVGLQTYQEHPEHRRVVAFLRSVHMGKVSVDYEV